MANVFGTTVTGSFQEAGGSRCCEPYVLVTSIDLRPARPEVEAFLYGPWQTTNPEDTTDILPLVWRESFWKLDTVTNPIANPDDVIFLIALMEHFDGGPSALRLMVNEVVIEALDALAYQARETRSARLIDRVNRAIDRANGGPNFISAIEIMLTTENIHKCRKKRFLQVCQILLRIRRALLPKFRVVQGRIRFVESRASERGIRLRRRVNRATGQPGEPVVE